MMKKISAWLVLMLAAVVIFPGVTTFAVADLKVSVSTGLDGKTKYGKGAPVTITVENNGTPFSGDIVIDVQESYSLGSGHAIPFDIGTGETKTVTLTLPAIDDRYMYGSAMTKRIYLYEGGWKKGKEVAYKGSGQITSGSSFSFDSPFVATFTTNVDRLAALRNMTITGTETKQIISASKLDASKLPDEALGWEAVDFMVVDEYPLADLEGAKQEALLSWVRSGGILVIGGSDNVKEEVGIFSDYLPLLLKERTETEPLVFNEWTKTEGFNQPIPSYETELQGDAVSVLEDNGNSLIAYRKVGSGSIYQTAFSVGDDPLVKMSGMPRLWEKLLDGGGPIFQPGYNSDQSSIEMISSSLGQSNELFPSFKVSAPLMFGIIILYIILIIPILYMILKRKDKREHTWWLIPVIALITSLAVFGYGAKDRIGRVQIQQTALLHKEEDGGMKGYFAESILSNKSGDFTLAAPSGTKWTASLGDNFFGPNMNALHKKSLIENDVTNTTMHLRDIGYWNVASVYGEVKVDNMGELAVKLSVKEKQLVGSMTNNYPFALMDVSIWSGTTLIPIGDLAPGETIQVDEIVTSPTLFPRKPIHQYSMNPQQTDNLEEYRKESVLSFSSNAVETLNKPAIVGYTDTQIIPIELKNAKPKMSALTMIIQSIDVDVVFSGEIKVEPEMFDMTLVSEGTNYEPEMMGFQANEYYFDDAAYIQTWQLPNDLAKMNVDWTSMDVKNVQKQLYEISLLNVENDTFDAYEGGTLEDVDQYMSPDGKVTIRITFHNSQDGNYTDVPVLWLSGEVAQ